MIMVDPEIAKVLLANMPIARAGTAEKIAEAGLFLASSGSRYMTGGSEEHRSTPATDAKVSRHRRG